MRKSVYPIGQMTRIGLLSDTHIPVDAKVLPGQIKEIFRGVDLILHAGDVYIVSVLDELERIAPVLVARGDDDDSDLTNDRRVRDDHTFTVEGVTISLVHSGPGYGPWLAFPYPKEDPGLASPRYQKVSGILVFGHTHMAKVENRGDFLLVNPGSPTFPHYVHRLGTVALLSVNSGEVEARIIQLR